MEKFQAKILLNTLYWGILLWLFGYVLGFIFFALVPKDQIGFYILPLGTAVTLWVLFKKIRRESFFCYIGLGVVWTVIALALDYIFIVRLLRSSGYYKTDVYYALTFLLPIIVGWYKRKAGSLKQQA